MDFIVFESLPCFLFSWLQKGTISGALESDKGCKEVDFLTLDWVAYCCIKAPDVESEGEGE